MLTTVTGPSYPLHHIHSHNRYRSLSSLSPSPSQSSQVLLTFTFRSMVTTCLRESSDLSYDLKFQRALQDLRASSPPWDSPGADRVRDALRKTRRIRSIRERGTKTVLACCDGQAAIYLVDVLGTGKHSGSHVVLPPLLVPRIRPALVVEGEFVFYLFILFDAHQRPILHQRKISILV